MQIPSTASRHLSAERDRLPLWLPVALMAGIGAYFALPQEPSPWMGLQLAMAGAWLLFFTRKRYILRWVSMALLLAGLGFAVAEWRTHAMSQPLIAKETTGRVEGRIADILTTDEGAKLVLADPIIEGLETTPKRIRISLRKYEGGLEVGDKVAIEQATVYPLPEPAIPGGYDFGRYFYFEGIGGVGYMRSGLTVVEHGARNSIAEKLLALRLRLAQDMLARMGEEVGTVAAALTVGEQSMVPDSVKDAMRDSGLYHILSISGVHLSIASGLIFFAVRLLLVLYPPLALRIPVKKIAAACALLGAFFYLMMAGNPVPAQRSFIMVAAVLCAVLLDRRGISMYALAWAALIILLFQPESMLGASFQMSFAATLAIVALYERHGAALYKSDLTWYARAFYWLFAAALVSLVASLATAPFVITHFNRFQLWGIPANLLVEPLNAFLIMPGVVLTFVLLPLGLEGLGYWLMEIGIKAMLAIAKYTAAIPHASISVPSLSTAGFAMTIAGLLWFSLWKTRWRYAGLIVWVLGFPTIALHVPPDLLVSGDGRQVMARMDDGQYVMLKGAERGFAPKAWLRAQGLEDALTPKQAGIDCTEGFCQAVVKGKTMIAVKKSEALPTACAQASDVLAVWWYVHDCPNARLLIDRNALAEGGAHAIYGERVETANETRGERPWTVH